MEKIIVWLYTWLNRIRISRSWMPANLVPDPAKLYRSDRIRMHNTADDYHYKTGKINTP
jgi:hypothetical protein